MDGIETCGCNRRYPLSMHTYFGGYNSKHWQPREPRNTVDASNSRVQS